jgi:1-deoxy-D-xylulose-5-phosphate reductoisomerase
MRSGGGAPVVMNAANEIAVDAFLHERIGFMDIPRLIYAVLDQIPSQSIHTLDDVLHLDTLARGIAVRLIQTSKFKRSMK